MTDPATPLTFLDHFRRAVEANGDAPALLYFDGRISYAELDRDSDGLAAGLAAMGVGPGARILVVLQNVPAFAIALLAAFKLGAVMVPANPMYRQRELDALIADCQPSAILCHDDYYRDVLCTTASAPPCLLVSPLDRQSRNDRRVISPDLHLTTAGVRRLEELIATHAGKFTADRGTPDTLRLIVYTSGTTGAPKGAMLSDRNLCAGGAFYVDSAALDSAGRILGTAPLFHVTGLSGHLAAAILSASTLILFYRFEPGVVMEAIAEHRPSFTVAAITALSALMNDPSCRPAHFESFKRIFSGGAPIAPQLYRLFLTATGVNIQNVYGLTETVAPVIAVPAGVDTPIDPVSGALSVGKPVDGASIRIVGENGDDLLAGEIGEIVVAGPSVSQGYWRKPAETRAAIRQKGFFTGDIGVIDAQGWAFIVDRKKDMIVASGFKVWPREVEDVLYTHPAVREAAVVGIPDPYRGESVKAVVALRNGLTATPEQLQIYCKERMAAYKYPRIVEIIDDLPKTATGKILRRDLR